MTNTKLLFYSLDTRKDVISWMWPFVSSLSPRNLQSCISNLVKLTPALNQQRTSQLSAVLKHQLGNECSFYIPLGDQNQQDSSLDDMSMSRN